MARRPRRSERLPAPLPSGAAGTRPVVAIVGRPNVGKSTLFNRLAGRHVAIVEDVPGVTRDRHYADTEAMGKPYVLVDTGGFEPSSEDVMAASIAEQVKLAVEECDIVICVLDATTDPTPADREAVQMLRQVADKPVLYVANKADSPKKALGAASHYELGVAEVLPVSALHGHGTGELEERLAEILPEPPPEPEPVAGAGAPRVAIVGRPNAGKSSLVNRLLGEERHVVDHRPGTTVDSIDSLIVRGGREMVLIDTAGMRKKARIRKGVEGLGVIHAIRSMERSDAVVLMIDAAEGPGEQDAKIAGLAEERGLALVIGLNKMDALDEDARKRAVRRTREILSFVPWAPVVTLSVKTGRGVNKLMDALEGAIASREKRVTTGELNRFFEEVIERHPPPTMKNRAVRIFYITQAATRPPTFVVVTNQPRYVHFSYQRYVVNQIRERFGFEGTAIRVKYRAKRKR